MYDIILTVFFVNREREYFEGWREVGAANSILQIQQVIKHQCVTLALSVSDRRSGGGV